MRRIILPATGFLLLALGCAPAGPPAPTPDPASGWTGYRAGGNEPFWTLTFTESGMRFADMGIADSAAAARPAVQATTTGWRFAANANGRPFVAEIERRNCNDSMSGRPFPHAVTVTVNGRTYAGCGGDTSGMITGAAWNVIEIDGSATAARRPTITFGAEDQVTGSGGCNTFRGAYRITGEGIDVGPVAATKMACAEAVVNQQETKFFGVLDQVSRFDVASGRLELYAGDRRVIVAER